MIKNNAAKAERWFLAVGKRNIFAKPPLAESVTK
jgi:hypothetical protein